MKIISAIGYSGSGKTYMLEKIIKKLRLELNLEVAVIKYIHEHRIDEEGKDSFRFSNSGAIFSIIKNKSEETAIFLKEKINLDELVNWLNNSPFKIDVILFESFRNLPYPTILCVKDLEEIRGQISENVKMISGLIDTRDDIQMEELDLPIVDIENNFKEFCNTFELFEDE